VGALGRLEFRGGYGALDLRLLPPPLALGSSSAPLPLLGEKICCAAGVDELCCCCCCCNAAARSELGKLTGGALE
jgi:hypothetical protein